MIRFAVLMTCAVALLAGPGLAADPYTPGKLQPTPPEELQHLGSDEGMDLYPADPVDGYPGYDPNIPGRQPRNTPQLLPYAGSVEHYTPGNGYLPKVLPYNHRTLVENFMAVDLPGVPDEARQQWAEVEYWLKPGGGQWGDAVPTGERGPTVPVVRLEPGGPGLNFELEPLPVSMYVVRVIGAIETEHATPYAKNMVLRLKINDGPEGQVNEYVLRSRGTDTFYDVGDFFFHSEDQRSYQVELSLHPDSQMDLLVHNVDVHDVLGEAAKRAGKTASLTVPGHRLARVWGVDPETKLQPLRQGEWSKLLSEDQIEQRIADLRAEMPDKSDEDLLDIWRQRRDDRIWNYKFPLNTNLTGDEWGSLPTGIDANYSKPDPATQAELTEQGLWPLNLRLGGGVGPWRLVHEDEDGNEQVVYTLADLKANKPLPGLPFDVPPWGKRFEGEDGKAFFLAPQAVASGRAAGFRGPSTDLLLSGDLTTVRDEVLKLVRFAYDMPSIDPNIYFSKLTPPSSRAYHRYRRFYQYFDIVPVAESYDSVFLAVKDNQELADAVGRYVPWVRTPEDVVALLDTYILQYGARQLAYWRQGWYDHGNAGRMAQFVAYQMDSQITEPWVENIFSRTWEYPYPPASTLDYLYLAVQRDGTTGIGSWSYTFPGAVDVAKWLEYYIQNGGDPKYDMTDPRRFPRVVAGLYFNFEGLVAGMQHPGIGDVGGYYRTYATWTARKLMQHVNAAWRWTRDPRFAYLTVNFGERKNETDEQWQEMVEAAETVDRHPALANRTRVLSDWGAILEGGTQSDDFRFRHGALIRVGRGTGHAQDDSMDLNLWSMGLPLNVGGGARGGYGDPETGASFSQNVVTVDWRGWQGHTWATDVADVPHAQYMAVQGNYQQMFERQVALIELDEGREPATPPSDPLLGPSTVYGKDIAFPRAYTFDVFRVVGGTKHEYNFQAFPPDDYSINVEPSELTSPEAEFISRYTAPGDDLHWGGTIGSDELVATFRLDREGKTFVAPAYPDRVFKAHQPNGSNTFQGAEPWLMGVNYDPESPRKFLRVHVLGQKGQRMLTGEAIIAPYGVGRTDGEFHRQVHVIREADGAVASSLFATIWEPYAGEPTIEDVTMEGDPNDADGSVALRVLTVDGIRDLCFADTTAKRLRTLEDGTQVQARFAYVSRDEEGRLRQASIVGGKGLVTDGLTIQPAKHEWKAHVLEADYFNKVVTLDRALPANVLDGSFFQVGAPRNGHHPAHWTNFEAVQVEPDGQTSRLQWRKGADAYAGTVTAVDGNEATVEFAPNVTYGENGQLMLVAEDGQAWRCDVVVKENMRGRNVLGGKLKLYSGPGVNEDDHSAADYLEAGQQVKLYEFGRGDVWRVPTKVSLRRVGEQTFELQADVPCRIALAGSAEWSADGERWEALPVNDDGQSVLELQREQLQPEAMYVRQR